MMRQRLIGVMLSLGLALLAVGTGFGQDYPARPVTIFAAEAGAAGDVAARIIAEELSTVFGQRVLVENRGGGVVAPEAVSKAKPDGHTLLVYANSLWLMPLMRSHVPYDPIKGFVPITCLTVQPQVLVVHPKWAVNSVKELVALAKAKPGQLNYSSTATGTGTHLAMELFKALTGTDIVRVTFKGMASALTALLAGETDLMFSVPTNALQQVKAGKLRALAISSDAPSKLAPGLPTVAASVPGHKQAAYFVLFAPAGTPAPVILRLNREVKRILEKADVKQRFFNAGAEVVGGTPEETAALIQAELAVMGKLIKDANIRDE
jgi:tripartite-type tricarboxylate transporter receptor subunit TctC